MIVEVEIPEKVVKILQSDDNAGRKSLTENGWTEYDAKFYSRAYKQARIRYGEGEQTEKAVVLSDIHYPHHDRKCIDIIMEFLEDYQPQFLIFLGDQLEMEPFSHWNKDLPNTQILSIKKDYDGFYCEILKPLHEICPDSKYIWFVGNHEKWAYIYTDHYPKFRELVEPENYLQLCERGYKVIPFNEIWKFGKLRLFHGFYWNMYHARKTVDEVMHSCLYGHDHTVQSHTKTSSIDHNEYYIAWSLPCLCTLNPSYRKNKPNRYVNGFGILEKFTNGNFNVFPVIINGGKFAWNGKVYQ